MKNFRIKDILYHGTVERIDEIDLGRGKGHKDFGKGFYLACEKKQSQGIIRKKAAGRKKMGLPMEGEFLYAFDVVPEMLDELNVKVFEKADIEWLDFILESRKSRETMHGYDVVIGPTADDDTNLCLNMYNEGVYGAVGSIEAKRTLLNNLEVENLGIQVFIGTRRGLGLITNMREIK